MATLRSSTPFPTSQEIRSVALYARVSTLNGQNPEMQLMELREYAQRRGWHVSSEYVDLGISGARESRPEFNRMMADAHARVFDAVACWKLDRMGRSLKHLVNTLADLQAYGVAFISLRNNLDLSTPSGRLMFHVVPAMAKFERALIRASLCRHPGCTPSWPADRPAAGVCERGKDPRDASGKCPLARYC